MSKKQNKENYEHLLTRIEKLEDRVEVLEFLRAYPKDFVKLETKYDYAGEELNVYKLVKFLNSECTRLVKLIIWAGNVEEAKKYTFKEVVYTGKPFHYIEERKDGRLEQVFKVDGFLERLHSQDIALYTEAYKVPIQEGTEEKDGHKKNSRKTEAKSE